MTIPTNGDGQTIKGYYIDFSEVGNIAIPVYDDMGAIPYTKTGTVALDENRGVVSWYDRDHWEWPNFVDDVLITDQTVSNTTQRTTVFNPTINPDSLIQGRIYQLDLQGKFSTANNSDTFEIDINLGGTDVAGLQSTGKNVTDAAWTLEFTFTVRTHGTNGTLQANTRATFDDQPETSQHDPVTVDTSTETAIEAAFKWTTADVGNTVTLSQAHLKQMG